MILIKVRMHEIKESLLLNTNIFSSLCMCYIGRYVHVLVQRHNLPSLKLFGEMCPKKWAVQYKSLRYFPATQILKLISNQSVVSSVRL